MVTSYKQNLFYVAFLVLYCVLADYVRGNIPVTCEKELNPHVHKIHARML